MTVQWNTITVRVSDADKSAIDLMRGEKSVNAFLSQLVKKEIEETFNPSPVPVGKGIPLQGRLSFKYRRERDNFVWQLDLGPRGSYVLAEDVSYAFIENLERSIGEARAERKQFLDDMPKDSTVLPAELEKYVVR